MKFSERLKQMREEKGLSQAELAQLVGLSTRMIQNYEADVHCPRFGVIEKLAAALEVPASALLGEDKELVAQAAETYGAKGAKQAEALTNEVTGLFAGGKMSEEDMDVMMQAISQAYWIAKENNRKYSAKKKSRK